MSYFAVGATVAGGVIGGALNSSAASSAAGAQIQSSQQALAAQQAALNAQTARLAPYNITGNLANSALLSKLGLGGIPGGANADISNWQGSFWAPYVAQYGENNNSDAAVAARNQVYNAVQNNIDSNSPDYGSLTAPITQSTINADPVYANGLAFGLNQGTKGIQNAALANGGYDSGATLKALTRFANDYGTSKTQAGVSDIQSNRAQQYGFLSGQQQVGLNAAAGQNLSTGNYANSASGLLTGAGNAQAAGIVGGANAFGGIGTSIGNAANNYNNSQLLSSLTGNGNLSSGTGYDQGMSYMLGQLNGGG